MSSPVGRADHSRRSERSRSREYERSRRSRHSPERSARRRSRSRERFSGARGSRRGGGSGGDRFSETENAFSTKGQGPPRIEGMISLKVDNITHRTSVGQLKRLFSRYGELGDIYVPRYPDSNLTRGFAFVRYFRKRDAEEAMRKLDGERIDGRVLSIQMAKYARPSSSARRDRRERYSGGRRSRSRSRSPRRRRRSPSRSGSRSRSRSRSRSGSAEAHSKHSGEDGGRDEQAASRSPSIEHGSAAGDDSPAGGDDGQRRRGSSGESERSAKDAAGNESPNGSNTDEEKGSDDERPTNGKGRDWDNQSDDN